MDTQFLHTAGAASKAQMSSIARRGDWRKLRLALVVGDFTAVLASFLLAYVLRFWTGWDLFQPSDLRPDFYTALTEIFAPCWVGIFALYGLYNTRYLLGGTQEYARVFNSSLLGMMLVIIVSFLVPDFVVARAWLILAWASALTITICWRFAARRIVYGLRSRGRLMERIVVLGANAEGRAVAEQLSAWSSSGATIVGFVDERHAVGEEILPKMPVLGPTTAFPAIVEQYDIDAVIIADTAIVRDRLPAIYGAMDTLQQLDVRLAPGLFELLTTGVQVREQGSVPLLLLNKTRITGLHAFGKLMMDRLGALFAVMLLSPIFIAITLMIFFNDRGPIFHRRRVIGFGKQPFDAFKFRTMMVNADAYLASHPELQEEIQRTGKLKDDPRITRIGSFLRRTSLDELPQLFNVLLGQMSLVGPRMLTRGELDHFGRWQHNLLTVRPGMTGLWQVSGRSDLGYDDRVRLDMHYIRNYSIWLDLYIILRTLPIVFAGRGAY